MLLGISYTQAGPIMPKSLVEFMRDESGATAIEYGLIAGLISVVIIAALTSIGSKVNVKLNRVSNGLN